MLKRITSLLLVGLIITTFSLPAIAVENNYNQSTANELVTDSYKHGASNNVIDYVGYLLSRGVTVHAIYDDGCLEFFEVKEGIGSQTRRTYGYVSVSTSLNLREGPGEVYNVITGLPNGTYVQILGGPYYNPVDGYNWLNIKVLNSTISWQIGYEGYVASRYII